MAKQLNTQQLPDRIIPIPEMAKLTSRSTKTLWRWWRVEKVFPAPILQSGRTLGWKESTYNAWLAEKSKG